MSHFSHAQDQHVRDMSIVAQYYYGGLKQPELNGSL